MFIILGQIMSFLQSNKVVFLPKPFHNVNHVRMKLRYACRWDSPTLINVDYHISVFIPTLKINQVTQKHEVMQEMKSFCMLCVKLVAAETCYLVT